MYNIKNITEDLVYVGVSDRRLALFENVYPIERGASFNSYLLKDEKTVLFDTVDKNVFFQFAKNLEKALDGRKLDYIVINHVEPDHAASLFEIRRRYPEAEFICGIKAQTMLKRFFDFDENACTRLVKEGDVLNTGRHSLTFVAAPMVHWPEVMVTYDLTDKILFSADAFGSFGSIDGNLFADEINFEKVLLPEMRRYYTNIVGKYGPQVQSLLKKAAGLDINMICPLHGPIWRNNFGTIIDKYNKWSTYEPEDEDVLLLYASVYGNTENAVEKLAFKLAERGLRNIRMYDVSKTHHSVIVAEAFRCSHIVVASPTYNAGIFVEMSNVLEDLKAHNLQNRTVAIIENGSWVPSAGKLIRQKFEEMKNIKFVEPQFTVKSSLKPDCLEEFENFANAVAESVTVRKKSQNPLSNIPYGLFLLSVNKDDCDNACIVNTVCQVAANPDKITVAVNKGALTCELIEETGKFNVSVLTKEAPFELFKNFGFRSGKVCKKFDDCNYAQKLENGIFALTKYVNTVICAKVTDKVDCGTHVLFVADVEKTNIVSQVESATYDFYLEKIKPLDKPVQKKGFVCKICGYVYEGEVLPSDFVCPVCKHGAEDFEPIK